MKKYCFCAVSIIALAVSTGAFAQETAAPQDAAESRGLEDIVVTAQRRNENLQDVPIAVSAITSSQLERSNVNGVVDLKVAVPAVNTTTTAGRLTASIRGIGSNAFGQGVESPVALYIDGVFMGASTATILSLNNIKQIEVLKGPQGTLFGRNATGGLINVLTLDPTEELTAKFNFSYANYDTVSANGYMAGQLTEGIRADIAATYTHQGNGWGTNLFNGQDVYKLNRDFAVRSKIVVEPSSTTKFTLVGDYSRRIDSRAAYAGPPGSSAGPGVVFPDIGYNVNLDVQPKASREGYGVSLRWDQDLGNVQLMTLSAYRDSKTLSSIDLDGSQFNIAGRLEPQENDHQFTQEVQLTSQGSGPFRWVLGGFYYRGASTDDPATFFFPDATRDVTGRQRIESLAGYAQGTYEIVQDTNFTVGLRYTTEKRSLYNSYIDVNVIGLPPALQPPREVIPDSSVRANKLTWRVSLDHRFSDELLVYASFNRGFKSGGYAVSEPERAPFMPETLDAYEIGIKSDLFDRRVRLNLSGFYYDYSDIQIQRIVNGAATVLNGAKARVYGVDAEFQVQVTDDLLLFGGGSWISPKFNSFPSCQIGNADGSFVNPDGNCTGNQLPLSSKVLLSGGFSYDKEIGSGRLNLSGNLYYSSGYFFEADNAVKQPKFALLGASATYKTNGGLSFGVFGKNLTNRHVLDFVTTTPIQVAPGAFVGSRVAYYQEPRTYGVKIGFEF